MPTRFENFAAGIMAVLLLAPGVLLHIDGDAMWIRVGGTVMALSAVVVFAGYLLVRKSIYPGSPIEKKFEKKGYWFGTSQLGWFLDFFSYMAVSP